MGKLPHTALTDNPLALASVILAFALLIAVIRANKDDLPAIVRALMRMGRHNDDDRDDPPSLPKA